MEEFGRPGFLWYAKRLAANDTLESGGNQAGPYMPKELIFELFPSVNRVEIKNPDVWFELYIDSHPDAQRVRAVWYNNKFHGGTRNESRLTNFGGQKSPLLDPDSTGSLAVFAFKLPESEAGDVEECHVWLCGGEGVEADIVEDRIGPVEPRQYVIWKPGVSEPYTDLFTASAKKPLKASCWLAVPDIPTAWLVSFPTGREIIEKTIQLRKGDGSSVDVRLLSRRKCEFEVFQSVEQATWMPRITSGFNDIESFLGLANTILQSRKSRAGNSLEYHTDAILTEEGFVKGSHYEHNKKIEGGKKPDFLFPSVSAYEDMSFTAGNLRMLAAKTTCKDRWRQILNEADRIPVKHLLTLQEGVSENQFREMTDAGVKLIVPAGLHDAYPDSVKSDLMTLEEFLGDLRIVLAKAGL